MLKTDIERHGRDGLPAVNVKVYTWKVTLPLELGATAPADDPTNFTSHYSEEGFDQDYLDGITEKTDVWFQAACEAGWESLQERAEEIWGSHVAVYSEGRSGGWAVVQGLSDPENWDDDEMAQWSQFAKTAREIADYIPQAVAELVYFNVYTVTGPGRPSSDRLSDAEALDVLAQMLTDDGHNLDEIIHVIHRTGRMESTDV